MPDAPQNIVVVGIVYGLLAAAAHAVAFAMSRRYLVKEHGSSLRLIVLSHVIMGIAATAILLPLWSPQLRDVRAWIVLMLGVSVTYLLGQILFSISLRHTASSRLVPLLGLKVVAVVPAAMVLLGEQLSWGQLAAVVLSLAAGAMLHHIGGRLPWRSLLLTLISICMFAVSDVYIVLLVPKLGSGFLGAARAVGVCYGFCGLVMALLLPWQGSRQKKDWLAALPHAACWLPSIYLLFACLALCGAVLGNIVIGTRGLFAIVLGMFLAARGLHHLEHHVRRGEVLRRFGAALLMIVAIGIYGISKPETPATKPAIPQRMR